MGLKRPFDDEFPELTFKHHRQGESGDRVSAFGENVASDDAPKKPNISGEFEDGFHKLQWSDIHVDETGSELSKGVDNDVETSAPFSWITSSSSEDDAGFGPSAYSSLSPEYFEFNFPRRAVVSFEDIYSSYPTQSPRSPRKQVPIGPNHQAVIPFCGGKINKDNSDPPSSMESNDIVNDGYEERLIGTCIIPMPDLNLSASSDDNVGDGRRDCSCLDVGSLRCVQQHIVEAREKLRDTLGQEKFMSLGFCNMGNEVATKWSEEEEQVFHEVVYSNPGKNFWKNLSSVFPSRTKGEIVSYYFNVFMLRRRAAQNRSKLLNIDSDDDEWHDSNGGSFEVRVTEDEDFTSESPVRVDHAEHEAGSSEEDDDDEDDDDDDNDDDDDGKGNGYGVMGDGLEDGAIDYMSEAHGNGMFDSVTQHFDRSPGSYRESFDIRDNSCMSFEYQGNNTAESCDDPVDSVEAAGVNNLTNDPSKCPRSKIDGSSDGFGLIYMLEPCDAKGWDTRYPTEPVKGVDLVPTCDMIDEIFGQGTWNDKKMDD